jgi:apolipoprotein N-acyltransferase
MPKITLHGGMKSSLWLPFLSGILLSLTLPAFGAWPLVWVALVPFFLFASNKYLSHARLHAGVFLFAMPVAVTIVYPLMRVTSWWWSAGVESFGMPLLELKFAGIILLVGFWGALSVLPFAYVLRRFGKHRGAFIVVAALWVAIEWLRSSFALFGYSWGVLGYALLDTLYLKHLASVGGVYMLSFLIVLGNMSIAEVAHPFIAYNGSVLTRTRLLLRTLIELPRTYAVVWFFLACFVSALFFGAYREQHFSLAAASCAHVPVHIAVISSSIPTDESIGGGAYRNYRAKIVAAYDAGASLIVLPENTFPFFELNEADDTLEAHNLIHLQEQDELYADFLSLSRAHPSVSIAVGLHTKIDDMRYNSLVLFANGKPVAYYHKRKLVPFAEYAPLGLDISLVMPFTAGTRKQYFSVAGVNATGLMCSEVGDTSIPLDNLDMIISPSNDSVFVSPAIALIHHRMARMRALEANAYLLRASKGGISAVIEPNGVMKSEIPFLLMKEKK